MATTWTPASSGTLVLPAGTYVAVVASVKASHSLDDLRSFAAARGLQLFDLSDSRAGLGPDPRAPDYRYVAAAAATTRDVSLPWEVPWPASLFDDSQLVAAWTAPAGPAPASSPTPPAPGPPRAPVVPLTPLAVLAAAGAFLWWRARRVR